MMNAGVDTTEWTDNDKDSSMIQKGTDIILWSLQILHFLIIVLSKPHANILLYFCFTFASSCFILHARASCFISVLVVL